MARKIDGTTASIGAELTYRTYLRKFMQVMVGLVKEGDGTSIEIKIKEAIGKIGSVSESVTVSVIKQITRNLKKAFKRKTAKELIQKASSASVRSQVTDFIFTNTLLIKNVTDEIKLKVYEEMQKSPAGLEPIEKRIKEATGFTDARAKLIARDQVSKLNAEMSAVRHKAAGFAKYMWKTVGDERVRDEHRDLDGKIYGYDQATDEKDGLPPGQPIQCRCIAEPIFEELIEDEVK